MTRFVLYIAALVTLAFPLRGITFYQHFCGDYMVSFEFFEKNVHECCEVADETCDGCMDQETELSLDDFRVSQASITIPSLNFGTPIIHRTHIDTRINRSLYNAYAYYRNPPVTSGKHLPILNQAFLL